MLTINFGEKANHKDKYIIVNGIADYHSYYSDSHDWRWASIYDEEATHVIVSYSHQDIKNHFDRLALIYNTDWWEYGMDITFYYDKFHGEQILVPHIQIDFKIETEEWSKAWSILEFAQALNKNIQAYGQDGISYFQEDEDFVSNGFGVILLINDLTKTVGADIDRALSISHQLVDKTVKELLSSIDENSLTTFFHFPQNIKTSCTQYLIYFAQFLADIGVEVNTEIQEEAYQTMFRIKPKHKSEALNIIQEALEIYLKAPSDPEFETQIVSNNDIAITQWQANIYHLKSQLALSQALAQAKDAQIEALQLYNYQYRQVVNINTTKSNVSNDEDIIKGVVTLKKFDIRGLSINLPEILRRLKRKLSQPPK